MGRSQLYKGRDTKHLTPAEAQLERLYDQIDRPGYRITPEQFFQTPQAVQLLDRLYGGLEDRIPPGSQIVSQTPGKVTYRDAEGFEHNIIRRPDGQFTESTNRPSIVPTAQSKQQDDFLGELIQRARKHMAATEGGPGLAELDPETAAALRAISEAEQGAINQQATDDEGRLLAGLFGNRVNQSSIATDAASRFAQQYGLVRQAQRSDAAGRELGVRQYLTGLGQQQNESLAALLANLSGQSTQRGIAGAGLDLDRARLAESTRQFGAQNYLDQLRTQQAQQQIDSQNSLFSKIIQGVGAVGSVAGLAGGGLSALQALLARNRRDPYAGNPGGPTGG